MTSQNEVTGHVQLLVFDMENIRDVKSQNSNYQDSDLVGYQGGKYHASGYRYILPLHCIYTAYGENRGNYFDTLGLDRSTNPHRLVAAAYIGNEGSGYDSNIHNAVVVFYDLDSSTGLLRKSGNYIDASDAAYTGLKHIQGVNARGNTVWFYQGKTDALLCRKIGSSSEANYYWVDGGEGLTYWPDNDNLWIVTERVGNRICFCVKRSDVS